MTGSPELLRTARERAATLRERYRDAGFWSDRPTDPLRSAASKHPDRPAVRDRARTLTFAELDALVDLTGQALKDSGVTRSCPVVIVAGNDVDSVVAVQAALRVDAVVLLVARSAGETGARDALTRSGARHMMAPNCDWPGLASADCRTVAVARAGQGRRPDTPLRPARAADEPCFVLYTSGTTSRPKGVVHSLSTLTKASANYIAASGLGAADSIFLISPLASITGVLQALFIGPMLAAPVVLEDRWDPSGTCDLLLDAGATWYGGPDRLLDRLLDEVARRGAEVPLRAVYLGGTQLDRRIVERAEDEFGIIVMRAYGSSEVPVSTSGLREEPKSLRHNDDGTLLADVQVRVGSSGEPTECCISGPHTFLGYTDTDDDVHAFDGEWFRTGDVAEVEEGRVRIVGRIKDIVIRNGLKIAAAEVDEAVLRIDGVRECAAYSVPDATTGERLAVALVLDDGAELSLADVASALTVAGLPKYKLPEELVFWEQSLPLNANGKVERNTLAQRADGRRRAVAPRLVSAN
ncbi:Medium-chain fatty-acid--CoA ligase [Mycolicibacterium parafortuitum]|uniref:class I adenylate-forming enzyme family protein n=1 Tax=Mycolicibacterium parafortuitum TaxID=39692 RepID=UPI0032C43A51